MTLWPEKLVVDDETGTASYPVTDFFPQLRGMLKKFSLAQTPHLPAVGSLMGYIGYDAIRLIEPQVPAKAGTLPTARLVFPSRFVVFDRARRVMTLVGLDKAEAQAQAKIRDTRELLTKSVQIPANSATVKITLPSRENYMAAVVKAKEYIRAGDIFQVVLADRYQGETNVDPFSFDL
ncbi:MAG: chorismate-binding protein, partial [Deltaproteobacteria bacterium]|nr:chorismate-binding protein [Deltaproteobacteria bacterium]